MPPPQAVRRRAIVTRASRSKARLRVVTKRRDPWRSHVHCTRFRRPRSSSSLKLPMQRGRGGRPLVLSLGGLRGILSFEKESIPLYPCSAKRCSPRGTSAAASFALVRKNGAILSRERMAPLPGSSAKRCITPPRIARISQCPFGHKKRAILSDGSHFRSISQRC